MVTSPLWLSSSLSFLFAAALATEPPQQAATTQCIAVAATSDIHGAIESKQLRNAQQDQINVGGLLIYAGFIANLRQQYGANLLVLDAGDMYQGTFVSNLTQGQAVQRLLEQIGVQATTIGNHEFDYGALPNQQDTLGALKQRIATSAFPFVSVNIFDKEQKQAIDWPNVHRSRHVKVGALDIGILGVTTLETPYSTNPSNIAQLAFREPAAFVQQEANKLRQEGANMVLLLAHMGGECKKLHDPHDISSCLEHQADGGELIRLLQSLPKGTIDVVIGGHTHRKMGHFVGEIATVQSGHSLQAFSWLEICPDQQGRIQPKNITMHANVPICLQQWADGTCDAANGPSPVRKRQFCGRDVAIPAEIAAVAAPFLEQARQQTYQPLAFRIPERLDRRAISRLAAAAFRQAHNGDIGLYNIGAVRTGLEAGQPHFGALYQSLPFDDALAKVRLQGKHIIQLAQTLGCTIPNNPKAPSFDGLSIIHEEQTGKVHYRASTQQPIVPDQWYSLITSRFFINGGDGAGAVFAQLPAQQMQATGTMMRDTLITYLTGRHPIAPLPIKSGGIAPILLDASID